MNRIDRILQLHKKWTGRLSSSEQADLNNWMKSEDSNRKEHDTMDKIWKATKSYPSTYQPDVDQAWNRFQQQMEPVAKRRTLPGRWMLRVAASLLVLVAAYFAYQQFSTEPVEVAWVTVATDASSGEEVLLPDGSAIWLGAESLIRYPEVFSGEERPIELSGMAFFEVEHDPSRPFRVQTEHGQVEVLGTSFLVRAYAGAATEEVVVRTGRVAYEAPGIDRTELVQEDKLIYTIATQEAEKVKDQQLNDLAWHTGVVQFRNTKLAEVLQTLERHFKISFDRTGLQQEILDCQISMRFEGYPAADDVLPAISLAVAARLEKVSGQEYRLIGGTCR